MHSLEVWTDVSASLEGVRPNTFKEAGWGASFFAWEVDASGSARRTLLGWLCAPCDQPCIEGIGWKPTAPSAAAAELLAIAVVLRTLSGAERMLGDV